MERIHLLGIRHHGPGSARSLVAALEGLRPDLLLVEGPPEAASLLPLALHEAMIPPVALLVYAPENPAMSAYYPFAAFSPEWQAIRYGLRSGIPVQMMDLPQANQMAIVQELAAQEAMDAAGEVVPPEDQETGANLGEIAPGAGGGSDPVDTTAGSTDPLRLLAEAAGYSESELWWDHLVEHRRTPARIFTAIQEAMTVLRESAPPETNPIAMRREAAMRDSLRDALKAGYQRIAVVCGAWHVPALTDLSGKKEDAGLLKGMPKIKVEATWVPWTFSRLTRQSGYGAGIDSPGWYSHLWKTEDGIPERWMIRVARLLREEDLDVSPSSIIDAVRLAEALAALRGRPLPGLPELNEAALTTLCFGNPLPMRLIEEKLTVGLDMGSVPPETPQAPLVRNFEREVRRLKLPLEPVEKVIDLDLRRPFDLERSHLLHRLGLLEIPLGSNSDAALQSSARGRSGTFHEVWRLKWRPDLSILLIEAGQWGNTLAGAAAARVTHRANRTADLVELTALVEDVLLADLPEAVEHVMNCLQALAAVCSDVPHLMGALPPLASVLRYGNVRQTDTALVAQVVEELAARAFIGLPGACAALNDDAAEGLFQHILKVDAAINRLDDGFSSNPTPSAGPGSIQYHKEWQKALNQLSAKPGIHGLITGRACRILLDASAIKMEEAQRRLGIGLSTAADPAQAAAWIEGFLRGSGQMLVHDTGLLGLIDGWLCALPVEAFIRLLPLLRRTFASFSWPERNNIGLRIRRGDAGAAHSRGETEAPVDFDPARADATLPLLAQLLGVQDHERSQAP